MNRKEIISKFKEFYYTKSFIEDWEKSDFLNENRYVDYAKSLEYYFLSTDKKSSIKKRIENLEKAKKNLKKIANDKCIAENISLIRICSDLDEKILAAEISKKILEKINPDDLNDLRIKPFLAPSLIFEKNDFEISNLKFTLESFLEKNQSTIEEKTNFDSSSVITRTLDLGCGIEPKNPFKADEVFGIDIRNDFNNKNIHVADLVIEKIPFSNCFFDYVTAYDFIEHVPRVIYNPKRLNPFIDLMNEIYRVLKKSGIFISVTPAYPKSAAFQDPTHVNIITEMTFLLYFDHVNCWANSYGFNGAFEIQEQKWQGQHLITIMKKSLKKPQTIKKSF